MRGVTCAVNESGSSALRLILWITVIEVALPDLPHQDTFERPVHHINGPESCNTNIYIISRRACRTMESILISLGGKGRSTKVGQQCICSATMLTAWEPKLLRRLRRGLICFKRVKPPVLQVSRTRQHSK